MQYPSDSPWPSTPPAKVQGRQAQAPGENRSIGIYEYSKIFIISVMIFNPLSGHFIIKKTSKKTELIVPLVPESGRRPKGGYKRRIKKVQYLRKLF